eukprot:scaffold2277_cov137-Cylindrotheca_fusiformis.AAC.17
MNAYKQEKVCIINVGHYRSGTTTLAVAAKNLGAQIYRTFPALTVDQHKAFLHRPADIVGNWFEKKSGANQILELAEKFDLICDGWVALLPFLPKEKLDHLKQEARKTGTQLEFVATTRAVKSTVESELQHWVVNNLEAVAGLNTTERKSLKHDLTARANEHQQLIESLATEGFLKVLPLVPEMNHTWPKSLSSISKFATEDWSKAIRDAGKQNANPALPIEGILLTFRFGVDEKGAKTKIDLVETLLGKIEEDSLCRYLVVVALDKDEFGSSHAGKLQKSLEEWRRGNNQIVSYHIISNTPRSHGQAFNICTAWNEMACCAWQKGADWVVLLGDDIKIDCPFHYRAFYRSFLDIAEQLDAPFGFGCPWWHDKTFPGFPTFPCVGKQHFEVFGGLIPEHRKSNFVNQDLDPYLHTMYSKFFAAPCVGEATLANGAGGNLGSDKARYQRVPCTEWPDFALQDYTQLRKCLPGQTKEAILLDVVVPSYRVRLDYLQGICSLKVPEHIQTVFIIIVDNPTLLMERAADIESTRTDELTLADCERILEGKLSESGNRVRVRCNRTNVGASASRNRGLDESASEFVLNLDDDLMPNPNLLEQYGKHLLDLDDNIVGLIGLVRFPRSPNLPLKHAAVLMSYLTFMFEIAKQDLYPHPAWGVTANILFRRTKVRFDLTYAKSKLFGKELNYDL